MASFKTLAGIERTRNLAFHADDRNRRIFDAAVLEIAHAISRGRKPSSCSVLSGQNIQTWLQDTFVAIHPYCHDHMGDKCSIADAELDTIYGWCYDMPDSMKVARAIVICRTYIRPLKKDADLRGDWKYQDTHKVTNRKRKTSYWQRRQGSHYDDSYYGGGMDDFDFIGDPHTRFEGEHPPARTSVPVDGTRPVVRRVRKVALATTQAEG